MSIASFSQFVTSCLLLVLSKNKIEGDKDSEDYQRVFTTCSSFFDFVGEHTLITIPRHIYNQNRYFLPKYKTEFDVMYDNFSMFAEFALKNIHVYDINTLCNGLETQIKKFMDQYEKYDLIFLDSRDFCYYDYAPLCCLPSFGDILYFLEMSNCYNYERQKTLKLNYEPKEMLTNLHAKRVSGHRQDFEKHVFNKGLNKEKRERNILKERKNKKFRDYRI